MGYYMNGERVLKVGRRLSFPGAIKVFVYDNGTFFLIPDPKNKAACDKAAMEFSLGLYLAEVFVYLTEAEYLDSENWQLGLAPFVKLK